MCLWSGEDVLLTLKDLFLWLHRRLTKEELERRSKENMLTEVGGKAVEAEEQVKLLRQRINEMEEQMKKTEEVYKEQVDSQNDDIFIFKWASKRENLDWMFCSVFLDKRTGKQNSLQLGMLHRLRSFMY